MDITPPSSPNASRIAVGSIIVVFGLLLTADNLGLIDAAPLLRFWPVAFIVIGMVRIATCQAPTGRIGGTLFVLVGLLLTVNEVHRLPVQIWALWPVVLIAAGLLMVFRPRLAATPPLMDQTINEFAFWSGVRRRLTTPAFSRGDLTAVMGGVELDLRAAGGGTEPAVITVFVIMGGIDIRVPPDWAVSNEVVAVMGGATDRTAGAQAPRSRLIVRGLVIMGGVEVKN